MKAVDLVADHLGGLSLLSAIVVGVSGLLGLGSFTLARESGRLQDDS